MWRFGAGGLFPVRPLRLVAQDIGFSVRRQGFDSPRGYLAIWQRLAPNRSSWQKGSFYRAFLCFLRFGATRCGRVLCLNLCRFGRCFRHWLVAFYHSCCPPLNRSGYAAC